jgi:hypothetical protein
MVASIRPRRFRQQERRAFRAFCSRINALFVARLAWGISSS